MSVKNKWELLARTFLEEQGLKFIKANYRRRFGEIDLIMRDDHTLVFVEVKYRSSNAYGGTLEQVTFDKQRKIRLTAMAYLQSTYSLESIVRFDVIGITPKGL